MRRTATANRRAGFTLVELIVVILIILILMGLLLQVIVKVREAGPRTLTRHEIGQLGLGIENFKSTYDVKYVPTALILASDYDAMAMANPTWAQALKDSREYLSRVWPKANFRNLPSPPSVPNPFPPNTAIALDGNQVLVFLLGGVPPGGDPSPAQFRFPSSWQGNRSGFLNSPTNPFNLFNGVAYEPAIIPSNQPPANWARDPGRVKGPFYDFKADRVDNNGHFSDPYKYPYYYFSSRSGNDYNFFGIYQPVLNPGNDPRGFSTLGGYGGIPAGTPLPGGGSAPADVPPMNPFVGLDGKFINLNGFQIVSAGKDNLPGPGSPLDPNTKRPVPYEPGIGEYSPSARGGDDLANFARGPLGGD